MTLHVQFYDCIFPQVLKITSICTQRLYNNYAGFSFSKQFDTSFVQALKIKNLIRQNAPGENDQGFLNRRLFLGHSLIKIK